MRLRFEAKHFLRFGQLQTRPQGLIDRLIQAQVFVFEFLLQVLRHIWIEIERDPQSNIIAMTRDRPPDLISFDECYERNTFHVVTTSACVTMEARTLPAWA